jgi:hypothetical protein
MGMEATAKQARQLEREFKHVLAHKSYISAEKPQKNRDSWGLAGHATENAVFKG